MSVPTGISRVTALGHREAAETRGNVSVKETEPRQLYGDGGHPCGPSTLYTQHGWSCRDSSDTGLETLAAVVRRATATSRPCRGEGGLAGLWLLPPP